MLQANHLLPLTATYTVQYLAATVTASLGWNYLTDTYGCPQIRTIRPSLVPRPPVIWWWAVSSEKAPYQRVGSLCRDGTDVQYMSTYKAKLYNSTTNKPKVSYSRLFSYLNPPKVAAHWYRHCLVSNVAGKAMKPVKTLPLMCTLMLTHRIIILFSLADTVKLWQIALVVIAVIFCLLGVVLWIAIGVVVLNLSNGSKLRIFLALWDKCISSSHSMRQEWEYSPGNSTYP